MASQKKGKHVRLYILEEDEEPLEKLASATGLSQTMVLTMLVSAGLRACTEAGRRMPLPLKFGISEDGLPKDERKGLATKTRR
jgi:hypothetical protein